MIKNYTFNKIQWLQKILRERVSLQLTLTFSDNKIIISIPSSDKNIMVSLDPLKFLRSNSNIKISYWKPSSEGFLSLLGDDLPAPGLLQTHKKIIVKTENGFEINYDFLGLMYWMFNRIEEIDQTNLDSHERFSARSSHAFKNNYLERPIVDEWIIILKQVINLLWPKLDLVDGEFEIMPSHDVDVVSRYRFANPYHFVKRAIVDTIKYHDFSSSFFAPWIYFSRGNQLSKYDRYNNFDWIMDQSELYDLTSTFYFMCGRSNSKFDSEYEPGHPIIRNLMRKIYSRGHKIGLHPSYNCFNDSNLLIREKKRLLKIFDEEGIKQDHLSSRMHYLRWKHPNTLLGIERAGINFDNTLSYADYAGFRCGTCNEYPAFDPITDKILDVRIRPLIAMEHTIKNYMRLGLSREAFDKFSQLKNACKLAKGKFTLLWHNNQLATNADQDLYSSIIK